MILFNTFLSQLLFSASVERGKSHDVGSLLSDKYSRGDIFEPPFAWGGGGIN